MNKFKKILIALLSVLLFIVLGESDEVMAEKGDPAEVNIKFYVYSDIQDMEEDKARGDFITVNATVPIKKGEVWDRSVLVSKTKKYAEPALKAKTGSAYSIVDIIVPPDSYYYLDDDSTYTYIGDIWRPSMHVTFSASNEEDYYSFSANVLAHKGSSLNGWKAYSDSARYYVNGKYKTGLQKIGQTTYLFSEYGGKKMGWHNISGNDVYFNEINGGLWTGKRKVGETTYLFNSQGHKQYGWHRLNGKDYFFNESNGGMLSGKEDIGETTYLFHNDGHKIKGWYVDNYGNKYYFDPNYGGGMVTGLRKVGNAYYYFSTSSGSAWRNRTLTIDDQDWYFNETGIGKKIK